MPLLLQPNLALALGCALSLAFRGTRSMTTRTEARRIVWAFAILGLLPATVFPSLLSPAWSVGRLFEPDASSLPVLLVGAALGAALCPLAFELAQRWQRPPGLELRDAAPLGASLLLGAVVFASVSSLLGEVPQPGSTGLRDKLLPLGEAGWIPLLGAITALLALAFGLSVQALRELSGESGRSARRSKV